MSTYAGRHALTTAACNGSLSGTVVAKVTLMWGSAPRTFTTTVTQSEPGDDVIALDIEGNRVALFSESYNNLTIHTFHELTIVGAR